MIPCAAYQNYMTTQSCLLKKKKKKKEKSDLVALFEAELN